MLRLVLPMAPSGSISARAGRPFITNGNTFYNDSSDDVSLAVFGVAKIKSVFLSLFLFPSGQ